MGEEGGQQREEGKGGRSGQGRGICVIRLRGMDALCAVST